jgi:hypothetical protein
MLRSVWRLVTLATWRDRRRVLARLAAIAERGRV